MHPLKTYILKTKLILTVAIFTSLASFSQKKWTKLADFIEEIKSFLIEMYDLETPFIEPPNLKY